MRIKDLEILSLYMLEEVGECVCVCSYYSIPYTYSYTQIYRPNT